MRCSRWNRVLEVQVKAYQRFGVVDASLPGLFISPLLKRFIDMSNIRGGIGLVSDMTECGVNNILEVKYAIIDIHKAKRREHFPDWQPYRMQHKRK